MEAIERAAEASLPEKRHQILIVEASQAVMQLFRDFLGDEYDTFYADNGPDCICIAQREKLDLILLDIMIPGMDGYTICAEMKSNMKTRHIPVIFITPVLDEEGDARGLECGAADYITKPVSLPVLKARVKNHLELKRHRSALEELAQELSDKNRLLEYERTLAHEVLKCILPQHFDLPGFTTAIKFQPSDQIGGDFFDAWSDGGCTHFLVGDISGHGSSAALMMAVCKGVFRSLGYSMNDPVKIVGTANRMLCPMMLESRMFLTLVYVVFDRRDNTVCFVSAGHNPVYHLDGSAVTPVESTGPAIGWDVDDSWESIRHRFDPGMVLFLYTDGLVEAKDASGIEFGKRLLSELAVSRSPQVLVDKVFNAAETFCGGTLADDVTLFVIRREGYE